MTLKTRATPKVKPVNVRIDGELFARLKAQAVNHNMSTAAWIHELLEQGRIHVTPEEWAASIVRSRPSLAERQPIVLSGSDKRGYKSIINQLDDEQEQWVLRKAPMRYTRTCAWMFARQSRKSSGAEWKIAWRSYGEGTGEKSRDRAIYKSSIKVKLVAS